VAADLAAAEELALVAEDLLRGEIASADAVPGPGFPFDPGEIAVPDSGTAASGSFAAVVDLVVLDSESGAFGYRLRQLESAPAAQFASVEHRQTYSSAERNQIR